MKDDGDLELARESIEHAAVENVTDLRRRAAPRQLAVERSHVERHHVEPAQLGETMNQSVPHLAARARHEDYRSARHRSLSHGSLVWQPCCMFINRDEPLFLRAF